MIKIKRADRCQYSISNNDTNFKSTKSSTICNNEGINWCI